MVAITAGNPVAPWLLGLLQLQATAHSAVGALGLGGRAGGVMGHGAIGSSQGTRCLWPLLLQLKWCQWRHLP